MTSRHMQRAQHIRQVYIVASTAFGGIVTVHHVRHVTANRTRPSGADTVAVPNAVARRRPQTLSIYVTYRTMFVMWISYKHILIQS